VSAAPECRHLLTSFDAEGFAAANQDRSPGASQGDRLAPLGAPSEGLTVVPHGDCPWSPFERITPVKRPLVASALASLVVGVLGIPVAQAETPAADVPAATPTCKLDTSPSYPSCVGVLRLADPPERCSTSAAPSKLVATCDLTTLPSLQKLPTGRYLVSSTIVDSPWAMVNGWRCTDHGHGFQVCKPVFIFCDDDDPSLCVST
jgi:hypothetical protein